MPQNGKTRAIKATVVMMCSVVLVGLAAHVYFPFLLRDVHPSTVAIAVNAYIIVVLCLICPAWYTPIWLVPVLYGWGPVASRLLNDLAGPGFMVDRVFERKTVTPLLPLREVLVSLVVVLFARWWMNEGEGPPAVISRRRSIVVGAAGLGVLLTAGVLVQWRPSSATIHDAIETANLRDVRIHLARGADIEAMGNSGRTPLFAAVSKQSDQIALFLIRSGADVNARTTGSRRGTTPLHGARSKRLVAALIAAGADVNARDGFGWTPISMPREPEATKLLLAHGADMNARTEGGDTPLHLLAGALRRTRILIEHGADVAARDDFGRTPLHQLCAWWSDGENLDARSDVPPTPEMARIATDRLEAAKLLVQAGSDVNAVDWYGRTPADIASEAKDRRLANLLAELSRRDRSAAKQLQMTAGRPARGN